MCFFTISISRKPQLKHIAYYPKCMVDETPLEKTCRVWFERFRNGDFDVRDKERSGQPEEFENFELQELLHANSAQRL